MAGLQGLERVKHRLGRPSAQAALRPALNESLDQELAARALAFAVLAGQRIEARQTTGVIDDDLARGGLEGCIRRWRWQAQGLDHLAQLFQNRQWRCCGYRSVTPNRPRNSPFRRCVSCRLGQCMPCFGFPVHSARPFSLFLSPETILALYV